MRPSISWLPILFVGAALFWTAALGLGSLSLSLFASSPDVPTHDSPCAMALSTVDRRSPDDAIVVRLQPFDETRVFRASQFDRAAPDVELVEIPAPRQDAIGRTAF